MKYPILKAEWIPVENPEEQGITHQNFKAYLNGELFFEEDCDPNRNSAKFSVRMPWHDPAIPPWNSNGELNKESLIGKCSKDCHHNINCEECNGHSQCHNCDYNTSGPYKLRCYNWVDMCSTEKPSKTKDEFWKKVHV